MLKNKIGKIMTIVGLLGIGASLLLIASITQITYLWLIGSTIPLACGIYLLRSYFFLR